MSQRQWIVIIGVWVMVFLFLGIPLFFIKVLAILTGLVIIILAYRIKFKETGLPPGAGFVDSTSRGKENLSDSPAQTEEISRSEPPHSPDYSNPPATPDAA